MSRVKRALPSWTHLSSTFPFVLPQPLTTLQSIQPMALKGTKHFTAGQNLRAKSLCSRVLDSLETGVAFKRPHPHSHQLSPGLASPATSRDHQGLCTEDATASYLGPANPSCYGIWGMAITIALTVPGLCSPAPHLRWALLSCIWSQPSCCLPHAAPPNVSHRPRRAPWV